MKPLCGIRVIDLTMWAFCAAAPQCSPAGEPRWDAILTSRGMDPERIDDLRARGIIG